MRITSLIHRILLLAAAALVAAQTEAEITWSRETGWRVTGGVLDSFDTAEGRNALDLMNKARSEEESGDRGGAIKYYKKVTKNYPGSVFAPEAFYRLAGLYHARHQYFLAFDSYQQIIARYPSSERFNEVVGQQYNIASELLEGARNRSWGFLPNFKNRERSIEYMEQIVANAPYSDYAPLSLMNIARGHQRLSNTDEAIHALDRLINFYPKSVLSPDAYLKLGQTHASLVDGPYYDQASTKEAITYFEDFMILFPGDANLASAEKGLTDMKRVLARSKLIVADYYLKYRKNYKAAKVFYNEAITVFPDSDVAGEAREKLKTVESKLSEEAPMAAPVAPTAPADKEKKKKRFFIF